MGKFLCWIGSFGGHMRTHTNREKWYIGFVCLAVIGSRCAKCYKFFGWVGSLGGHVGTHTNPRGNCITPTEVLAVVF